MTSIRHISDREIALERENARLVDKTERQAATIHVQAVAIQAMKADAERYQWLRMRLEVRKMQPIIGPMRDAIDICIGAAFFDTKFPRNRAKPYQIEQANNLDAAIDEAIKESKS